MKIIFILIDTDIRNGAMETEFCHTCGKFHQAENVVVTADGATCTDCLNGNAIEAAPELKLLDCNTSFC